MITLLKEGLLSKRPETSTYVGEDEKGEISKDVIKLGESNYYIWKYDAETDLIVRFGGSHIFVYGLYVGRFEELNDFDLKINDDDRFIYVNPSLTLSNLLRELVCEYASHQYELTVENSDPT